MKEKIKRLLADIVYTLYHLGILHNKIQVTGIEETVEHIVTTQKSLVRFGDGEIKLISGKSIPFQEADTELAKRLKEILEKEEEGLLVALPDTFSDVAQYIDSSRDFWKEHMLFHRKEYVRYCNLKRRYENAFFSRPYIMYRDKEKASAIFEKMKEIWANKEIVFVEGEISHNAVDVDLFAGAKSIERIICPSSQAYQVYDDIYVVCRRMSKSKLFLVSLGAAGKLLTVDLYHDGYRVLDIGSLDMEYGWFMEGAEKKCRVPKHEIRTREENLRAGYEKYLDEIVAEVRLRA